MKPEGILWGALVVLGGVSACGGSGNPDGLVASYDFSGSSTSVVRDRAGSADLTIEDPANVTRNGDGLTINTPTRLLAASTADIVEECQLSNELSLEAWVSAAAGSPIESGPARILTMSTDENTRNFMLGHEAASYAARLRTTDTGNDGTPELESSTGALGSESHIVYTRTAAGAEVIYVDGNPLGTDQKTGTFDSWDTSMSLCIANECNLGRAFVGTLHAARVYCRALTQEEVTKQLDRGP